MKIKNHVLPSQVTYIVLFLAGGGGRKEERLIFLSLWIKTNNTDESYLKQGAH